MGICARIGARPEWRYRDGVCLRRGIDIHCGSFTYFANEMNELYAYVNSAFIAAQN
jgi:hypothetical protein